MNGCYQMGVAAVSLRSANSGQPELAGRALIATGSRASRSEPRGGKRLLDRSCPHPVIHILTAEPAEKRESWSRVRDESGSEATGRLRANAGSPLDMSPSAHAESQFEPHAPFGSALRCQ